MTISLDQMKDDIQTIERHFYEVIHHPYFSRYLSVPVIDHDLISILYYGMKKRGCSPLYIKNTILASLLVETALSVHDAVESDECMDERTRKERQLTVLSGDYYSSLYYYFLAKLGDVSLMQVFSRSIQAINEIKMLPYETDDSCSSSKNVRYLYKHTILTVNILKHLKLDSWIHAAEEFFYLKKLLKERKHLPGKKETELMMDILSALDGQDGEGTDSVSLIMEAIEESRRKIEAALPDWLPVRQYIHSRMQQLLEDNRIYHDFVAEEG
ncbi:hypothetical protein CR205_07505 [Alteribacter lacisalsi]|uniref:Heptaprenyl diphosphate synthase n=1 Tax=Alteribacter lacisalsi TaxID=2045244 RepID=A0A2W0HEJ9_9BACI|nr:heptaprenyl diphosphate synthase component 1 [Alteribacter lacisalsi]PYZ98430.1 hypothetical protein CR205_07505 [Alteribacter lacisalsi]